RERRSLPTLALTDLAAELGRRGEERLEDVVELDRLAEREDAVAEEIGLDEALDPVVREGRRFVRGERGRAGPAGVDVRVEVRARAVLRELHPAVQWATFACVRFDRGERALELLELAVADREMRRGLR